MHDYLPIRPGADLVRAGLASNRYAFKWRDLVVLAVWTIVGLAITMRRALARHP